MKRLLGGLVALLACPCLAQAGEEPTLESFYAANPAGLFQGASPQALTVGFLSNDEVPYQSWKGQVGERHVYVELHGDEWRIHVGSRRYRGKLSRALRTAETQVSELDPRDTSLYVSPAPDRLGQHVLCLASLPQNMSRGRDDMSVYIITSLHTKPIIHQAPPVNASCRGLVRDAQGHIDVPVWSQVGKPATTYDIHYIRLTRAGFIRADRATQRIRLKAASN